MKQPFKKALLTTAVAFTCGTATAGTLSVTKQVHSIEGLAGVTATQTSNALSYTLDATYRAGDKITFTFPSGTLNTTTPSTGFEGAIVITESNAGTANARAGLTLGLLNALVGVDQDGVTVDTVTYRVTEVAVVATDVANETTGNTIGQVFNLSAGIPYSASALLSAPLTVTVSSETSNGDVLDTSGTRTATVAEAKTQFGTAVVTGFDATIDVAQMRKAFLGATSDSMSWVIANPTTTGWLNLATVNATAGTVVTVSGEAGKFTGLTAANFASSNGVDVVDADNATVTVTYGSMTTNDTITFTPTTGDDAVVLEAQDFASSFVYNYASAASQAGVANVGTAVDSGEWELNGATVNVPYMPYGANVSQIIYVSNDGDQAGDVSVTVFDDKGQTYELGVVATAAGNTVTKLATVIGKALQAANFTGTKASITITVNAPSDDITVYASYNVGGSDRGFVNTDQYKGKN